MKVITSLFKKPKVPEAPAPTPPPPAPGTATPVDVSQIVADEAQKERIRQNQLRRGRALTLTGGSSGSSLTLTGNRGTLG